MSTDLKKKILITTELESSAVGAFFKSLGFELEHSYTEGSDYRFVLDNACPEIKNVPRLQISESLSAELLPMVCGRINKEMFDSEQGCTLLSSYFHDALEFDLVDRYSKEMSNIYSIKIHEYLNIGYFVDSIIIEAYKAKFDISVLRDYLNTALNFSFKKVETSTSTMPVDVSYSHNGEAFAVQISLLCDEWKGISEMESSIDELIKGTNYFDVTYFHKTNRLILSALIFKNLDLASAKANFFTEVVKRRPETEKNAEAGIYSGLVFNEPVRYQPPKQAIADPAIKLLLARKFAHFIKNYRQKVEDPPIPLGKLVIDDVINYLAHYPIQEELQEIDSEVKHLIFKLLMNDKFSNDIDDFVQVIMDSFPHGVVREIHKIMGDKGLEDIEQIISGQPLKIEDGFITRVKGSSETKPNPDFQRVSGSEGTAISDNDLWEIRKAQLNIKDQADMQFTSTASEEKNNDNKRWEVQSLSRTLTPEAKLEKEKFEEAFSQQVLNQQSTSDVVKEKLESQMDRIKKIMYQLKKEILKLQSEKIAREEADRNRNNEDAQDVLRLKSTMERSLETIKNKDYAIEKMKKDFDQFIKNKDQKIEALENRISSMKNEQSQGNEASNDEKVMKLENENKSLNFKLELANKKVNIVTTRMKEREVDLNAKREREIETIKGNLKLAQSIIEEMKIEKTKLEIHASEDRDQLKKNKEDTVNKKNDEDKDGIILILSSERKTIEEKFRAQSIELKKAEQKLKYTLSQLESAHKKKPTTNPNLKSAEVLAKQLDQASSRMAEATAEVIEKRREIVKVKQENSMMSSKIAELEKKLANLDKKVA